MTAHNHPDIRPPATMTPEDYHSIAVRTAPYIRDALYAAHQMASAHFPGADKEAGGVVSGGIIGLLEFAASGGLPWDELRRLLMVQIDLVGPQVIMRRDAAETGSPAGGSA